MSWITGYIIPFIVLLGVLVFVHEMGHFLVAKYFKITVEKFSIGFGPRIFGKKVGDTEYRVAWIPLGGYVKMAGDDPTDDAARELPGSFLGAPVWKRMLVVLAGPGVNLILPIFILAGVYMVGKPYIASVVGNVSSNTPAAKAGLKPGDEILDVDGKSVRNWDDMTELIRAHKEGEQVRLTILRDGKQTDLTLVPEMRENEDEFGIRKKMPLIGIVASGIAATVDPVAESPAAKAGLKLGDRIEKVGTQDVMTFDDLARAVATLPAGDVSVKIERTPPPAAEIDPDATPEKPKELSLTLAVPAADPSAPRLEQLGIRDAELVVAKVAPDSPAETAGVHVGDRIKSVAGEDLASATDYRFWLRSDHPKDEPLVVEREGKDVTLKITPVKRSFKIPGTGRTEEYEWDGFSTWFMQTPAKERIEKYTNPLQAIAAGVRGTGEVISLNVRAFSKIFHHEISVRDSVGGPIRIAQVAGLAAKAGPSAFIEVLVQLSVILGIMNLLPIPVLDGGHFAFFAAEAVLRRPPSLRVREVAQQVGMLLLLAVMAFVMVNDVVTSLF